MRQPIIVEIPHQLGFEAAKVRLESGFTKLTSFVPGATVTEHHWNKDTLSFEVEAMGQRVAAKLDVFEDKVRAELDLPPLLSMFANKARELLSENGRKLLR